MKTILTILAIVFFSACSPRYQATGVTQYRVQSIERSNGITTLRLEGIKGTFDTLSDTVKIGDIIPVSWVKRIR